MKLPALLLSLLFVFGESGARAADAKSVFTHPGIMHSREDLDRIHDMVQAGFQPWARGFEALRTIPQSSLDYAVQGPFDQVAYEHGQYEIRRDASAIYNLALMWVATGDERYAAKSLGIFRAWTRGMQSFDPVDHITAGMATHKLAVAAEILRYRPGSGWMESDTAEFTRFLGKMMPALGKPDLFMNQGGYALLGLLSVAVFTNDEALYRRTIKRATVGDSKNPLTDAALSKTIWPSGQVVEMGRDQTHPQGGLGTLACMAQTAFIQGEALTGTDLFGYLDERLRKGYEYLAAHNLGYEEEYAPKDETGREGYYPGFSKTDRGKFSPIYELAYAHYRWVRKSPEEALRYVAEVRSYLGTEGFSEDFPGFGTLTATLAEGKEATPPVGPPRSLPPNPEEPAEPGRFPGGKFSGGQGVGREYFVTPTGRTELIASNIQAGDYAEYADFDFGDTPVDGFLVSAGSASIVGCQIDVMIDRVDSDPIATLKVGNTGWWSTFEMFQAKLKQPVQGRHRLFLRFFGSTHVYKFQCNLEWFKFGPSDALQVEIQRHLASPRFPMIRGEHYAAAVVGKARRTPEGAELKADGTTLTFPGVEFSSGARMIAVKVAGGAGAKIEIRAVDLASPLIAAVEIPAAATEAPVMVKVEISQGGSVIQGNQMLFLRFQGNGEPLKLLGFQLDPPAAASPGD